MAFILAKPLFCSIADKYAIHERVLICAILGTTISYGLLAVLPFLPFKNLYWPLFCVFMFFGYTSSGVLTSITDSLVLKIAEPEGSDFGKIRVWGTIGWGLMSEIIGLLNKHVSTDLLPHYVPGILLFIALEVCDLILMGFYFKIMREEHVKSDLTRERRPTLQEAIEQSISTRARSYYNTKC